MRRSLIGLCLVGASLLVSCAPSVSVTVVNRGNARLDSLRIVSEAGDKRLRDMAPGESLSVSMRIASEDMLQLRGRLAGHPLPRGFGGFVERGDRARIVIGHGGSQAITVRGRDEAR